MRYWTLTVLNVAFTGLAYLLAPVLPFFCKSDGYLPNWLTWFQTFDASLDAGWKDGYAGYDATDSLWWNRTKWLWRNPAYGFCYYPLGIVFNPADWIVQIYEKDEAGNVIHWLAVTKDGRYFNENINGAKTGWKAFNYFLGFDAAGAPMWKATPWGPEWRAPICWTPKFFNSSITLEVKP